MVKKILLITLGFSLAVGGFWASQAQDPMQPPQTPSNVRTTPPVVAAQTVQTDLSGTYAGTFNCDALGLTGDTTMTINGNEVTFADGRTGRIVASTTRGYTAIALQVNNAATGTTPATTAAAPMVVSLRGRKSGDRLTLTSVAGSTMKCSFVPSRSVARGRRKTTVPAATGTEVSAPAAVPSAVPTESPRPSPMPSPMPSSSPSQSPSPTPSPMPSPTPNPEPSPEPNPSPTPSGTPTPAPTPTPPEPTPSPSPSPSPSPTPTPRP